MATVDLPLGIEQSLAKDFKLVATSKALAHGRSMRSLTHGVLRGVGTATIVLILLLFY